MKNKIFPVLVLLAAVSCGPLGKYKNQEKTQYRTDLYSTVIEATDSLKPENVPSWQEFFIDPYLRNLISKALANNIDLKISHEHVIQAQAALTGARLAYVPSLNITPSVDFMHSRTNGMLVSPLSLLADISWEVDIFGRLANRKDMAKASLYQKEDEHQAYQVSLIQSVARLYYNILMLDADLATAEDMIKTWEASVKTINALKREGFADEVAVSQYEATLADLHVKELELMRLIRESENAMALIICEPCNGFERGKLSYQPVPELLSCGVPIEMLTYRPDVKAAQRCVEVAFYTTKDSWLNFFPTLTISGSATIMGPANPLEILANIGAGLVAPVFNMGINKTKLKVAESQQRQAKLAFQKSMYNAGREVYDALCSYRTSCEKVKYLDRQVRFLLQARHDTELLMLNSESKTYLDVLIAHNSLFDAEFSYYDNMYSSMEALVNLYAALGGGSDYQR